MKEYGEVDFYRNDIIKYYDLDKIFREQLNSLDTLDPFTRKHSENVGNLTCRLCEKLKLEKGFTIYTSICGFIHDIGKMFIDPKILQKEGKLTNEEFEIMKTHTTIGYNMCMKEPKLRPYSAGPLYHHEALDGTGYPNGLVGDEIMYEGQIIRVADEFDAITSKRQYKTHIGVVDTLKILIENSQPGPKSKKIKKGLFKVSVGKNNKKIVEKLIEIVAEDTEYEIYVKDKHLDHLRNEIKRYQDAYKYFKKAENEKKENKKEYFTEYAKGYLIKDETFENIPIYLHDIEETYQKRKEEIDNLRKEYKTIKKLKV